MVAGVWSFRATGKGSRYGGERRGESRIKRGRGKGELVSWELSTERRTLVVAAGVRRGDDDEVYFIVMEIDFVRSAANEPRRPNGIWNKGIGKEKIKKRPEINKQRKKRQE